MYHFIDGKIVESNNVSKQDVINPITGEIIGTIALNDLENAKKAVSSCQLAFQNWSQIALHKKIDILIRWYQWLQKNKLNLAKIIHQENGKTEADALSEMDRGIEVVQFALSATTYLKGEHSSVNQKLDIYTRKYPIGITCGIVPFNFPGMIPLWMVPISIVCGNTFILKASELVPSCAVELAKGAIEVGLPPGVFNVIQGGKTIVEYLCQEPKIKNISFVGSTKVGRIVEQLSINKRLQLNMAAKNHAIVMPDADLKKAADSIVGAAYGGCGQRCMALSVVITVGENPEFKKYLVEKAASLKPYSIGPMITQNAKIRLLDYVNQAVKQGATLLTPIDGAKGNFVSPIILGNVNSQMKVYQEELFGPVLTYFSVDSLEQAIEFINKNPFGNGCAIFTSETSNAEQFEKNIEVGQIGINVPIPVAPPYFSWTSTKESFSGMSHIYGPESFDFYTIKKTIMKRSAIKRGCQIIMPTN